MSASHDSQRVPPNPSGLCMCGCGQPTKRARNTDRRAGWVKGEHMRFACGHHIPAREERVPAETLFWRNVEKTESCWLWHGGAAGLRDQPYGTLWPDGKPVYAHRFAYELLVGPIPEGLYIDHLCRFTLCVNPAHLEPVSNRENILRGAALKTHCPRGHPYAGRNLYVNKKGHRICRACRRVTSDLPDDAPASELTRRS